MSAPIRVGKISSINYEEGTARVLYTDRDNSVTRELPFLSSEYNMPKVGDQVLVVHISSGEEAGVIIGKFWSKNNKPSKKVTYQKEFGDKQGEAYVKYEDGKLTIKAATLSAEDEKQAIEVIQMLLDHQKRIEELERKVEGLEKRVEAIEGILGLGGEG